MCNKSETDSNKILWCPWKDKSPVNKPEKISTSVECENAEDNTSILSSSSSSSSSSSDSDRHSLSPCSTSSSDYITGLKSLENLSEFVGKKSKDSLSKSGAVGLNSIYEQSHCHLPLSEQSAFTPTHTYPLHPELFSAWLKINDVRFAEQCYSNTGSLIHSVPSLPLPGSVQHAAQRIHEEDIAAKRLKKLRPKKFQCQYCVAAFSNNGQLRGHVRIHTGERPYKCDAENCGKSFTRNEELTRHKRIHTGLRPHSCDICGKKFGRKDHLKKHTRTHENRSFYHIPMINPMVMGHHPLVPGPQLFSMPHHTITPYQIC